MKRQVLTVALFSLGTFFTGCGGGGGNSGGGGTPAVQIQSMGGRTVVDSGGMALLTASVTGLGASPTFSWTLSPSTQAAAASASVRRAQPEITALPACPSSALGSLNPANAATTTYTPPLAANVPSGGCGVTATVTATGKGNTVTATFSITVTGPISVTITNPITSIAAASGSVTLNATVTNDENSLGVTWSFGTGDCSAPANACGTFMNATATSVTYVPPPNPPSPSAQVIIIAASKASAMFDSTANPANAADTFTVTPAVISLVFSPNPPFTSVSAGGPAQTIAVNMQHDTGGQGVGFSFASSVCNGPSFPCGTLTSPGPQAGTPPSTVQTATYKPPATQTATSVTIIATAVGGRQPSISFTFTIGPPGISVAFTHAPPSSLSTSATAQVSVTVTNDSSSGGVDWTVTCSISSCGSFNPAHTASGMATTFTAPSSVPTGGSVTIKAASTTDPSKSVSAAVTIHAALAITTTSLASGTAGTAYSATVAASGGVTPYTWLATGLPTGLTLTSSTPNATISGATDDVGTFSITVTVHDSGGATASAMLTLTTAQAPTLAVSTTTLPNGTENTSYNQMLSATGGVQPYAWTMTSGNLPAGMSLSATGVISGTPTATGSFSFTVKVTDAESPAQSMTQALSLTINPVSTGLNITTTSPLPGATLNSAYHTMVTASGGSAPYTFTLASNSSLPAGLSLTSGSPSGTISGTPTATGTFRVTIDVKDSASPAATASASFLITVTGSSSFTCPSPMNPSLPLCGTNLFEVAGFPANGGVTATIFVVLIDSNGNIISGEETSNDSANGYATHTITGGDYVMDSSGDGRGVIKVIDSTAASATYRFAVFSQANYKPGPVEQFDSSGVLADGITVIIPTTPVPQIPANTVLGGQFTGVTGAGHKVGVLGTFEVGPNGCDGSSGSFNSQSGETIIVNNGGTVTTGLTATGSCSAVNANGIGSAQVTLSGGTPFTSATVHFTYVEYNNSTTPTFAIFLSTDSIGANQPVLGGLVQANPEAGKVNSSLFAGYCGGSFACVARQSGTNGSADNIKALMRFVATSTSGTGGTLSGTYDQNAAGTITTNAVWPYTAYTVDANGVGTFTGSGQKTVHFLYTNGGLYTLDESSEVRTGDFDQQNSVTVENPGSNYVLSGNYAGNGSTHFLGILVPTGTTTSGTLPGIVDVISNAGSFPGAAASGTYASLSATGRSSGTANFTNGASAINTVIYIARHRRFWVLDMQTTTPGIADVILQ